MPDAKSSAPELDAQIALRISRFDLDALERAARKEERSISYLVRRGIALVLGDQSGPHGKS
jgi:hypothetical protein